MLLLYVVFLEHVLILPIVHVSSTAEMTETQLQEMNKYKNAIRRYFQSRSLQIIFYERNIPTRAGQHCHLQVVPVNQQQADHAHECIEQDGW